MGLALCCLLAAGGCRKEAGQVTVTAEEREALLGEKGYKSMSEYVEPGVISHGVSFYGLVESGFDNKLLTLNNRGEFSYLNLEIPEQPRLEVISPGFPGVGGQLISDAENRVAWIVRGRGIYFIDLDSLKTGHMIAGNRGRVIQVLLTDKERLLFAVTVFPGAELLGYCVYELSTGTDHGLIVTPRVTIYNSLGNDMLLRERQVKKDEHLNGWYLSDTFWTKERNNPGVTYPAAEPLTQFLTGHNVHAVNEIDGKLLHQGKRLLFAWSYIDRWDSTQMVIVRWDENLEEVKIFPLVQDTLRFFYQGPMHISGDGNWMKGSRIHRRTEPRIEELVVYHLQDYYPQGISGPVSLGYTNKDPGAFFNHRSLGPCYIEQPLSREGVLLLYRLNDAVEIIRGQALGAVSDLSSGDQKD
jgi:hypothetical protein